MSQHAPPDPDAPPPWFGRRRGKRLRPHRQHLMETLLPRLRVPLPGPGETLDPAALFEGPVDDVWLEVGFGAGEHLAAQAADHPGVGFIGCEPFLNGVANLLSQIEAGGLDNVRLFEDDARRLLPAFPEASLGRAFVLFADPWPKRRHHDRRFINPGNLDLLARLLKDDAVLRFASDHMGYVRWALFHVRNHPCFEWTARRPADWRRRPPDAEPTRYERKALGRGDACVYLEFRRIPRDRL